MFKSRFDSLPQNWTESGKSSYLQGLPGGCIIIQEAFQYPTRLGRQGASRAGRLLFMSEKRRRPPEKAPPSQGFYLRLRPPRLPSMLRFRSAIFPSEEERNCLSLSSKDWSPEGGRGCWLREENRGAWAGRGAPPADGRGPPGRGPLEAGRSG